MSSTTLSRPGTLVRARGREWAVLPESTDELLMLRPLGGLNEEVTGILPSIEPVETASFRLPELGDLGDFASGRLLRDAARLSTRAAAGPFRSFGRIAVDPKPYQLVPLMMAMKLDPVRLLIADDVGIGKTIEASLIVRELLDRGEIQKFAVLCPPHLAEQWQRELAEKFHLDAELVLSSTIQRLERDLRQGESVFDRHHYTVVSTDFIKSSRRADDFAHKCPECVIVDEAHGCTKVGGIRHQRHEVLRKIVSKDTRHVILVTATPHNGNEDAFRSLLCLLDKSFEDLPDDLSGDKRQNDRRRLAQHLVQRRRADIRRYLKTDTSFPERLDKEKAYNFHEDYQSLFEDIAEFAREYVTESDGEQRKRRVRYWSALGLLRCVSSSPAAAVATLRSRAVADLVEEKDIDEMGRRTVLDLDDDSDNLSDFNPGAEVDGEKDSYRRKLKEFAHRAGDLDPSDDLKLKGAIKEIKDLLKEGFHPVVFCRFVDTARYVAHHLRKSLPKNVQVESVTGLLPPVEREARIGKLVSGSDQFVLVCTDCLSEGINLQQHFDSVLHYDLAWNPTRHEQREGRVDRFGQSKKQVRVITYYGKNSIDGIILNVLIQKHKNIKSSLGITVAVPCSSEDVAKALFEGLELRGQGSNRHLVQQCMAELEPWKDNLHSEWDNARDREKVNRSLFAQHPLKPEDVETELEKVRKAIGDEKDVELFVRSVLHSVKVPFKDKAGTLHVYLSEEVPKSLRQAIWQDEPFTGRFSLPLEGAELHLGRTSPVVEGLAEWVLDQALNPVAGNGEEKIASRCGVIRTSDVQKRTTLLVVRYRSHLKVSGRDGDAMLCEEILPLAFSGSADDLHWLDAEESERIIDAHPEGNPTQTLSVQQIEKFLLPELPGIRKAIESLAKKQAKRQLRAHERVREASRARKKVTIEPIFPVDILGAYILLPPILN